MIISGDVLDVLATAITDGNALTLPVELDRRLYARTNTVLTAAGGRWNRAARAHLFPESAGEVIETMLLTGRVAGIPTLASQFGYFPTPGPVLDRVLGAARLPQAPCRVLEPSAGRGAIARAAAERGHLVDCVELLEENAAVLNEGGFAQAVINADFLTVPPTAIYDRVLMNPPFAKQADLHHIEHAHRFLRPDGLLVAVVSNAVTFRKNALTKHFRALIDDRSGQIEKLPDNSFRLEGTGVSTVLLTLPA